MENLKNVAQRRFVASGLVAKRSMEGAEDKDSRTVSGYAIVFDSDSQVLNDWGVRFIERINRSCVSDEMLKGCDIKMTMFHNREKLLARWNKGVGSLRLSVDDKGVAFEFEAPRTELGDYALDAIERGDISGCSFSFAPEDYVWSEYDDEVRIEHTKFRWLGEMTLECDPAYLDTEVEARGLIEAHRSDLANRLADERAEAQRRSRVIALAGAELDAIEN